MIQSLDVIIWNRKVGTLVSSRKGYREQICFYFDADFVKSGLDIFPLRASIRGAAAQTGLPIYPEDEKIFGGLPSFIADSLPDHWGNVIFREWAKAHNIRMKELTALDRLAYIGRRGMGALEFHPTTADNLEMPFQVNITQLSEFARIALKEATDFHAVITPEMAIESLFKVGTSAGGRRPKAVVNVNQKTGECYSGQVATPYPGFVPMIVKFDEHTDIPSTRIEYSYYLMAKEAGMRMMPSCLLEAEDGAHFMTERFDRNNDEKIHVQTLAALSPSASSYEDLFTVASRLGIEPDGLSSLFLHMVMNVMAGNVDDHNKNFSFIMNRSGRWELAPSYDFTFTIDPSAPYYVNRHCMTIAGKDSDITREDIITIAARFNIKGSSSIIEKATRAVGNYHEFAEFAGIPESWIRKIENHFTMLTQ